MRCGSLYDVMIDILIPKIRRQPCWKEDVTSYSYFTHAHISSMSNFMLEEHRLFDP